MSGTKIQLDLFLIKIKKYDHIFPSELSFQRELFQESLATTGKFLTKKKLLPLKKFHPQVVF